MEYGINTLGLHQGQDLFGRTGKYCLA